MALIAECVPGKSAKVLRSGVARIVGKTGTIVEVKQSRRLMSEPMREEVTIEVPGHGPVAVAPGDIEVLG